VKRVSLNVPNNNVGPAVPTVPASPIRITPPHPYVRLPKHREPSLLNAKGSNAPWASCCGDFDKHILDLHRSSLFSMGSRQNMAPNCLSRLVLAGSLAFTLSVPEQSAPQPDQPRPEHLSAWVANHSSLTLPELLDALRIEPGFGGISPSAQQRLIKQAVQLYMSQHPDTAPPHLSPVK